MKGTKNFWSGAPDFMKKKWFWPVLSVAAVGGITLCAIGGLYNAPTTLNETMEAIDDRAKYENTNHDQEAKNDKNNGTIYNEDHPVLYDNAKKVREFIKANKNSVAESINYQKGMEMGLRIYGQTGKKNSDILQEIELYPKEGLNLEQATEVVKEYLPTDISEDKYKQSWSHIYYQKDKTTYAQLYVPTEVGKKWIKDQDNGYNYALIMIEVEDNKVKDIILRSTNTLPNMGRGADAPKTENWNYSIF